MISSNFNNILKAHDFVLGKVKEKRYRLTPVIVTLYEGVLSYIDIKNLIEIGLQMVRFRMSHVSREGKERVLVMLDQAKKWLCEKYDVPSWPTAVCIDLPNVAIRSGLIDKKLKTSRIWLPKGQIVTLTCDIKFLDKMDSRTIFMDDPYTIQVIKVGCEITLCSNCVKMICVEVLDKKNIKCKVIKTGNMFPNEFITVKGIKFRRPTVSTFDLELLQFAKELKFDVITIYVRTASTIRTIRKLCGKDYHPLIVSAICEQEGLDNFDEILQNSDGIILAREIIVHQIFNIYSLPAIQMQLNGKCKQAGKPFFISGNILEQILVEGTSSSSDLSDITNAVLQGCGFMLRHYTHADHLLKAMQILHEMCMTVEIAAAWDDTFLRILDEYRVPVDAAQASVVSCAIVVKQTDSSVIVLPTVTGRTAVALTRTLPSAIIIAVTKKQSVSRRLQLYRGITAITYDKRSKSDWHAEMDSRIQFAVKFGVQREILNYGDSYVTLCKSESTSSFPDSISIWKVTARATGLHDIACDLGLHPKSLSNKHLPHVFE